MSKNTESNYMIPRHVAIIMDGNGRWALQKGLKRTEGHKEGLKAMEKTVKQLFSMGIEYVSLYAFSIDNWKRDSHEIQFLTNLIHNFYRDEFSKYKKEDVKILVSGVYTNLDSSLIKIIEKIQDETKDNKGKFLHICFNYGGRLEIVEASKKFAKDVLENKKLVDDLDIDIFYQYLFQSNVPMVDLMIRTSGEYRISDFLIYQNSYAEFYFTPVLWPDFDEQQVVIAIKEYSKRNRRFGGV